MRLGDVASLAAGFAAAAAFLAVVYYELVVRGVPSPIPHFTGWYYYASIAAVIAMVPYAVMDQRRRSWEADVERNLPRMLSDLEGLVGSGLSPLLSLRQMAQKDYGALSRPIRRVVSLASWGYSYDSIKRILEREFPHQLALVVFRLLLDAEEGGGDIASAVRSLREYLRDVGVLKGELQSTLRMQSFVVYLALIIFLYIAETALSSLLVPTSSAIGIGLSPSALSYVRSIMFGMYVVEAILGGLSLGKMTAGSAGAGVKHAMMLLIIGIVYIMILG